MELKVFSQKLKNRQIRWNFVKKYLYQKITIDHLPQENKTLSIKEILKLLTVNNLMKLQKPENLDAPLEILWTHCSLCNATTKADQKDHNWWPKVKEEKKRRDLKCHLVPYHGTQTWRIAATYSSLTSFTTFCSVSLATRAKQKKCLNLWCFRSKVIFSILTKLEMAKEGRYPF